MPPAEPLGDPGVTRQARARAARYRAPEEGRGGRRSAGADNEPGYSAGSAAAGTLRAYGHAGANGNAPPCNAIPGDGYAVPSGHAVPDVGNARADVLSRAPGRDNLQLTRVRFGAPILRSAGIIADIGFVPDAFSHIFQHVPVTDSAGVFSQFSQIAKSPWSSRSNCAISFPKSGE
jgi:hypothetical protein